MTSRSTIISGAAGTGKTTLAIDMIKNHPGRTIIVGMLEAENVFREDHITIVPVNELDTVTNFNKLIVKFPNKFCPSVEEQNMVNDFLKKWNKKEDVLIVIDEAPNVFSEHIIDFINDVANGTSLCHNIVTIYTYSQLETISSLQKKAFNLNHWNRFHLAL